MQATLVDGDLDCDKPIVSVADVYRRGRSLFDPASHVAVEIQISDATGDFIGELRLVLSLDESKALCQRIMRTVNGAKQ